MGLQLIKYVVVSLHIPWAPRHDCLLKRLFRRRSKETSKLRVTGLCAGNTPVTGEFPAQRASNAENVSIWWRHHTIINKNFAHVVTIYLNCLSLNYRNSSKCMIMGDTLCHTIQRDVNPCFDSLMQERRNSSALAMELRLLPLIHRFHDGYGVRYLLLSIFLVFLIYLLSTRLLRYQW